jgi:membrane protein required for colicin V production
VAIVVGFRSGLIRSAATILGYISAAPLAVQAATFASRAVDGLSSTQGSLIFLGVFLVGGMAVATAMRMAIDVVAGVEIGPLDRLAGSLLGLIRVSLIAVTAVLVFDRIIPAGRDPAFLAGSLLRPVLSVVARTDLKARPPETAAFIDQIKSRRQI